MKKIIAVFLSLFIPLSVTGCAGQNNSINESSTAQNTNSENSSSAIPQTQPISQEESLPIPQQTQSSPHTDNSSTQGPIQSTPQEEITSTSEQTQVPSQDEQPSSSQSTLSIPQDIPTDDNQQEKTNILIAYFTWAENTHVDDPSSVDVDATTSASVLLPGNVGLMAQWIAEETGGDRFSIITEEPYSSNYDACLDRAVDEHDSGSRPAITGHVDNIGDYDVIFLGFPNWWYSCPMAILTFIDEHDLSGKTIVPFCSHGTGGFAASLRDIGNELPNNCTVLEEFGAYRPEVKNSKNGLLDWLSRLNIDY